MKKGLLNLIVIKTFSIYFQLLTKQTQMKNFNLSQRFNLQLNRMNYRNCNLKVIIKISIFLLVSLTYQNNMAQGALSNSSIKEVNSYLSEVKTTSVSDYQNLDGLIHNLNPAIYTYDNTLKIYGENCTVLFSDIASLNFIKNNTIPSNSVEIVRINISKNTDLSQKIDLSIFSNFPNLKYIYLFSIIESNETTLNQMFQNYDSKYTLVYSINLGE